MVRFWVIAVVVAFLFKQFAESKRDTGDQGYLAPFINPDGSLELEDQLVPMLVIANRSSGLYPNQNAMIQ